MTTPTGVAAHRSRPRTPSPRRCRSRARSAIPTSSPGKLWVPQIRNNRIAIVDPADEHGGRFVKTGTGPFVVTQIAGEAWVPSWKGKDIWRIRP